MFTWRGTNPADPLVLLVESGLCPSKSEARRLIEQGAVALEGQRLTGIAQKITLTQGAVLRVGNRKFRKIELAS